MVFNLIVENVFVLLEFTTFSKTDYYFQNDLCLLVSANGGIYLDFLNRSILYWSSFFWSHADTIIEDPIIVYESQIGENDESKFMWCATASTQSVELKMHLV